MTRMWQQFEKAQIPNVERQPLHRIQSTGMVFNFEAAPNQLRELAVEAYFYLIRNGYVVERLGSDYVNPPRATEFRWTERGYRWLEGAEPVPELTDSYMQFLRSNVRPLDEVIEQYIVEALTAFERQAFFAAAVMLGAACEKAMYDLAEAMLGAFSAQAPRERLQKLMVQRSLKPLLDFIRERIVDAAKRLVIPYPVTEGSENYLMSIAEAVRVQRNDAVHPKNAKVSEESVRHLLVAFPYALHRIEAIRAWLLANPLSI